MRSVIKNKIIAIISSSNIYEIYGFARSILALALFLTLVFNNPIDLFFPYQDYINPYGFNTNNPLFNYTLFILLSYKYIYISYYLSLIILVLVIIGWKPRITCILHWYVVYSFMASCVMIDGGDQIHAIIALLLIPIGLFDNRKFHWSNVIPYLNNSLEEMKSLVGNLIKYTIKIQVAFLYFQAFSSKLNIEEWQNGTAIYYWLNDSFFGAPEWLIPLLQILFKCTIVVTSITWSVLIIEAIMSVSILVSRKYYKYLFITGIIFHGMIALTMGLLTFFITMIAILVLYFEIDIKKQFSKLIE